MGKATIRTTSRKGVEMVKRRATTYLVTALGLIALVAVWQGLSVEVRQAPPKDTDSPRFALTSGSAIPQREPVEPTRSDLSDQHSSNTTRRQLPASLSKEIESSATQVAVVTVTPPRDNYIEVLAQSFADDEDTDRTAMIGRPFPVSASVEFTCRKLGGSCDEELDGLLSKFAHEPRDPAWAAEMETRLREFILTSEPGKFSIRAVECRTSLCVVEVASGFGAYIDHLESSESLSKDLFGWIGTHGYEVDQASARVTVTLQTFMRR